MENKEFSNWLLERMRTKGISVQQLADELDVSPATVYRWRTGSRVPIPDSCEHLAKYFDASSEELMRLTGWKK